MPWGLIAVVTFSLTLAGIAHYAGYRRSKAQRKGRRVGYEREEIQINMADVPEFKPTWKSTR